MPRTHPAAPYLEPVAGGLWWTVGAAALDGGTGTVVLAAGLAATAAMVIAIKRRHGAGGPLSAAGRRRLLLLLGVTVALMAVTGTVLGYFAVGELSIPVACAMAGAVLVALSSTLEARSLLATGAASMVLGAAGALLALSSAGSLYPQGLVGLVAGALLWLAGAHRSGLLTEARARVR